MTGYIPELQSEQDKNVLYVYGTLRPGNTEPVDIPGVMCDLGWYPGVALHDDVTQTFKAERIVVTDEELRKLDQYEGYRPDDPESSLYLRVPYQDGEIYVYNSSLTDRKIVESGDWLVYYNTKHGSAIYLHGNNTDVGAYSEETE